MAEMTGQQTVEFSSLVGRAAEESYLSLKELVENAKSADQQSDSEKKIGILKFLVKTQQRMLRLNVLSKWCQQVPLIQHCEQLSSTLSNHETCFTQAADSLFFMHEGLQQARAPIYDVPSAVEILLTGNYQRLPKCIEDVGVQSTLKEDEQQPALKKLDTLVRSKLLEVTIPKEMSEIKVSKGTATLRVDGEFKVLVTLGYRGHMTMWRILHLELLVGERSGHVKIEESRRYALGDDLERRMAAAENPFVTLYSVLHELCVSIVMDTIIRQVRSLLLGRWKDAIRFELLSDVGAGSSQMNQDGETDSSVLRTPGLKVLYWLDDRSSGNVDSASCPYIKIEPGSDLQLKCSHSSFLIDPSTSKEAKFSVDQSCIDVEQLLLKTICCNRYTRLLEIYKELIKNGQICRAAGDVILQCYADEPDVDDIKKESKSHAHEYEGQEVLRVRAYGSSFFSLGISIRNGRFLLHSARNILTPQALQECEEALNQGSMTAADVFTSLRSKSVLHLLACIGNFIGLQVYEHGFAAVEVPKNMLNGQGMLLLGFPDCGSSYFLLMQLDKDFKPLVKLLETGSHPSGKTHSFGDLNKVIRVKDIDIGQIKVLEDELNLSLLDSEKIFSLLPNNLDTNLTLEHGILSEAGIEGFALTSRGPPSSFSSIVDEIFDLDRGSSAFPYSGQSLSSSFNTSSTTHVDSNPLGLQNTKAGAHMSNVNIVPKISGGSPHYSGPRYSAGNLKGIMQSSSVNSLSSGAVRSSNAKKLSSSKSDQDLASLKSPYSADLTAMMDTDPRIPSRGMVSGTSSWVTATVAQGRDLPVSSGLTLDAAKSSRRRTVSDMLNSIPSLQCLKVRTESCKRRKIAESGTSQTMSPKRFVSTEIIGKTEGYSYASLVAEANKGNAPSGVYVSALLHVVRHCSLCIKHARLTSQMDALEIPYVEEVGLRNTSSNLWFRVPFARGDPWQHICLRLGRPGSMYWDVKINDQHFRDLWELQKGCNTTPWASGVRIANTSDIDSHIRYDPEGVVLSYHSVEEDSIKKLVADIQRLYNARMFALGMRKLLGVRPDDNKIEEGGAKNSVETADKFSEQMRRAFRIEAVGLMSLWFSFGSSVLARFVVEWESGKEGCTMHVSPDQLWPHTKFLEDFINGAEVASLLDCIRLTAGPLHALAAAIRPARAGPTPGVPSVASTLSSMGKPSGYPQPQGPLHNNNITATNSQATTATPTAMGSLASHNLHGAAMLAAAASRGGPGLVPSSLLPIDVSVVLRGPYWVRIIYRKYFAVDMRCFAGDQVWLQPATPPKGGPSAGGSLPCPQFRPFIMEHVAQELNVLEPNQQPIGLTTVSSPNQTLSSGANRPNFSNSGGISRPVNQMAGQNRIGNALSTSSNLPAVSPGVPVRRTPGAGVPAHLRGELNTAIIGLGDDGGYGGGWVPLVALKKVLRGILKYLGVLWLFAQLPDLLKEILGSILKDNEGALLNLDQEQPALRFFVGGYVFAVSVHRVQLLLQVLSVKRFHHSQQQQPNSATAQEELTQSEIGEICDYFSRRVASEPYDASRVASFITLLTLPISVIREFLKLIAWKKGLAQVQGGDTAPAQKPRIELCLENHAGLNMDGNSKNLSATKSNIHHDRPHNSVDFALTVVLDPTHIPHINAAGGAAWLPHCVSVRLKYSFGETPNVVYLGMEGSHGGRACWLRNDDWETCKQRVARIVEVSGSSSGDGSQGRLRVVADNIQRALQLCLQSLRDGGGVTTSTGPA